MKLKMLSEFTSIIKMWNIVVVTITASVRKTLDSDLISASRMP